MEVDLLSRELRVAVELDGPQHLADAVAYRRDRRKDRLLQAQGYLVLRFLSRGGRCQRPRRRVGCPPSGHRSSSTRRFVVEPRRIAPVRPDGPRQPLLQLPIVDSLCERSAPHAATRTNSAAGTAGRRIALIAALGRTPTGLLPVKTAGSSTTPLVSSRGSPRNREEVLHDPDRRKLHRRTKGGKRKMDSVWMNAHVLEVGHHKAEFLGLSPIR